MPDPDVLTNPDGRKIVVWVNGQQWISPARSTVRWHSGMHPERSPLE